MDGDLLHQQKKERLKPTVPFTFFQIVDLSPECPEAGTFPISFEKAHKSAHRLQRVDLLWMITLEDGNLDGYGCNQIIVLIVHIVTLFLNEVNVFFFV